MIMYKECWNHKNEFMYNANFLLFTFDGHWHTYNISMYDLNARLWLVISELSGRVECWCRPIRRDLLTATTVSGL